MMTTPRHPLPMNSTRGFTLVETLVAIAILMIAIVGPFYSVQQAITSSYVSRDQLIATSLAQEGAEYIYFVRDNNYLTPGNTWTQGMDNCMAAAHPQGCTVEPSLATSGSALVSCPPSGCAPLNLNGTSGIYTQVAGYPTTRFTRTVTITTDPLHPEQITVTSHVGWVTNHQSFSTIVTETLYNWL